MLVDCYKLTDKLSHFIGLYYFYLMNAFFFMVSKYA